MMVWMLMLLTNNALSFIMGQIVAMETIVTATVSLRLFRYWTGIFACGLHMYVQNLSNNWQFRQIYLDLKKNPPLALGKVIEPRSNVTNLCDFSASWKSLWWLVQQLWPIMCLSCLCWPWPWPLCYVSAINGKCRDHTGLPPYIIMY